jgi:hypothetical protein
MKKTLACIPVLMLVFGLLSGCGNRAQEEDRYAIKAQSLGELMTRQASACVSQSKAYMAVWEYARVSEVDFKTAAKEMLGAETSENKAMMVEHKSMIENLLEELSNPSSDFESTYDRLSELYGIYVKLHDLAMDPSDDMQKHMETVDTLMDQVLEKKRELDATFVVR